MDLIADVLLGAGAIGAAVYCAVLSRRLRRLTQLEGGMGSAIAVLSAQVDELTGALAGAQSAAERSARALETQTARAEAALARMELVMAALHDLPDPARTTPPDARGGVAATGARAAQPATGTRPNPNAEAPQAAAEDRPGPAQAAGWAASPFGARVVPGPGSDLHPPVQDDDSGPRRARVVRRRPGWEAAE